MNRYLRVIGPLLRGLAGLPLIRQVIALGGRLVEAGTDGYPVDVKRRLMILNMIAYLIFVTTVGYAFQFAQMPEPQYRPIVWINIALAVVAALVPFSHRINDLAGAFLILISEYAGLTAFAIYLGTNGGVQLQFFVAAAAPFVVFGPRRLKLVIAVVIGGLALHLYTWFNYPPEAALIQASRQILDDNYRQAAITTFGLIAATVWYAFKLAEQAKAETDRLLRNILPDTVVERLKLSPDAPIADTFGDASILFSDISGFVPLARSLGAARVVALLNVIVREFDELAARHGVEKIKTIGDAYMAAAGIPVPVEDHAVRLTRMALDMLDVIARLRVETGLEIQVRIGIASGPVMAGVIGTRKFSYDVWGDTVNLAARLENRSSPGRILVCPDCRRRLAEAFVLESRGEIDIKGVGLRETFFVVPPRPTRI